MPPPEKPAEGVEFPLDSKGARSTTGVNQETFAVSVEAANKEAGAKARAERNWRKGYAKHVLAQVELSVASPEKALAVARAGLDHLHKSFEFVRDGNSTSVQAAMDKFTTPLFETGIVKGEGKKTAARPDLGVPYKGNVLRGSELKVQLDKWVRTGVIETSCGQSIAQVANNPGWLDLSDKYFVLFGAGSAMGPFPLLMSLGANVIALDLDRQPIWDRLIKIAKESSGSLIIPLKKKCADPSEYAANAGCNLLTQTPEIRTWLLSLEPSRPLVLGAYAYLDGPLFVRVSMAMDAIIKDLVAKRTEKPAVAYLCTPTDAHVCTPGAATQSLENFRRQTWWQSLFAKVLGFTKGPLSRHARRPIPSDDGAASEFFVTDCIVNEQGPNYILAKRLQHWRAMVSRESGCVVSSNIAPSTATVSVVSNKSFAMAYGGMHHFRPMEVFQQETSNAVMGALLINDLRNPISAANPATPLRNPLELFSENAFHGGAHRVGFKFGNIGVPSAVVFCFLTYVVTPYLLLYNFAQAAGWGLALAQVGSHAMGGSAAGLWNMAGWYVTTFQFLMLLEVLHAALGMVRSSAFLTFTQIFSRIAVVSILNNTPKFAQEDTIYLRLVCGAWALTEVVRYVFYGLNMLKVQVPPLTWIRYSFFILLYPLGVAGELGCIASGLDMILGAGSGFRTTSHHGPSNLLMDAILKPLFVHKYGMYLIIVVYLLGFPPLYLYMLAARKKVLGSAPGKQKKD